MRLSLILPTLNERDSLRELIPRLLDEVEALDEILVVDDGSQDGTREVVLEHRRADARVELVERTAPPSLVRSLQQGFDRARGELIGWMDADLSMPVATLNTLVEVASLGADLAVGSRFLPGGGIKGQVSSGWIGRVHALQRLRGSPDSCLEAALSLGLNVGLLPLLTGRPAHDYTSGFAVARRDFLAAEALRGHHGEYFIHLWERAWRSGRKVVEVPYTIEVRRYGETKTAPSTRVLTQLGWGYLRVAWQVRRARR